MTQQLQETLLWRGRTYEILDHPLAECSDPKVLARMKQLHGRATNLWRGYLGHWAVRDQRLWLVQLNVTLREEGGTRGLSWLFPGYPGPVPADWYSGELRSPRGKAERTGPHQFETPSLRVLHVKDGRIVASELRDNRAALKEKRARYAALQKAP